MQNITRSFSFFVGENDYDQNVNDESKKVCKVSVNIMNIADKNLLC